MWFKATQAKFEEVGHTITTERQLADRTYIVEKSENLINEADEFMKKIRLKTSIEWFTQEEVAALIALEPSNEVL